MGNKTVDYILKKDCCGCGVCQEICPFNAIRMEGGELGNIYPKIDDKLCKKCSLCYAFCSNRKQYNDSEPENAFVSACVDKTVRLMSASGGFFSALAKIVIENGGVAYGANLAFIGGEPIVRHIRIDSCDRIKLISGSLYVESNIHDALCSILADLNDGKKVLFCGTSC